MRQSGTIADPRRPHLSGPLDHTHFVAVCLAAGPRGRLSARIRGPVAQQTHQSVTNLHFESSDRIATNGDVQSMQASTGSSAVEDHVSFRHFGFAGWHESRVLGTRSSGVGTGRDVAASRLTRCSIVGCKLFRAGRGSASIDPNPTTPAMGAATRAEWA